jgi:hypothetical protein
MPKTKLLALALVLGLASVFTMQVQANEEDMIATEQVVYESVVPLSTYGVFVRAIQQERTLWCWAAASVAVIEQQTRMTITQSEFVRDTLNISLHVPNEELPNRAASFNMVRDGLYSHRVRTHPTRGRLNAIEIRENFLSFRPIFAGLARPGVDHAVVVVGYNMVTDTLHFMDPHTGTTNITTLTALANGTPALGRWVESVVLR